MSDDHDCGWLECTVFDCSQSRRYASEQRLTDCNINRDGSPRGLPVCGNALPRRPESYTDYACTKSKGHSGKHSQQGYPWGGWA